MMLLLLLLLLIIIIKRISSAQGVSAGHFQKDPNTRKVQNNTVY